MTIISEIRRRPWIMLLVVGLALLAFLLDPGTLANFSLGSRNKVGEIAGVDLRVSDYEKIKSLASQNLGDNPQITENYIANIAWDELLNQTLVDRQWEELGLRFNEDRFWELAARQFGFISKSGQPDAKAFKNQLAQWQRDAKTGDRNAANAWNQWLNQEDLIKKGLRRETYMKLVASGMLVTNKQLDYLIELESDSAAVQYVKIEYPEIYKKKKFEVSDQEIKEYIKAHPYKYDREENRSLDYVIFRSASSEGDIDSIKKVTKAFAAPSLDKDQEGNVRDTIPGLNQAQDSALVVNYSDRPVLWQYFSEQELMQVFSKPVADFALSASEGQISEPIRTMTPEQKEAFVLAKLNSKKQVIDSSKVSHILFSYLGSPLAAEFSNISRSKAEAKKLADSVLNVVKANPAKFNEMVKLSDDRGLLAQDSLGNLPWITKGSRGLQSLQNFALNNGSGSIGLAETQAGFHIIKVNQVKTKLGYRVAAITKFIQPSEKTQNKQYQNANDFYQAVQAKSRKEFAAAANKKGYSFNSTENAVLFENSLNGLSTDKDDDILQWAFLDETKVGDIKQFSTSGNDIIVAYLAGKEDAGLASVESVKNEVTEIIKKQKATAYVQEKTKGKSLALAAADFDAEIAQAGATYNSTMDPNLRVEAKVLGTIAGLKSGKTAEAIQGETGVFLVNKLKAVKTDKFSTSDREALLGQLEGRAVQSAMQGLLPSLVDYFKPEDRRKEILEMIAAQQ